jgi:hypothetical protein
MPAKRPKMPRYLFLTGDYKNWIPEASLSLSLLEECLRRDFDCFLAVTPSVQESISVLPVLFADPQSSCFIGFGPKASLPRASFEVALTITDGEVLLIQGFRDPAALRALESKFKTWPKTSSRELIAEMEALRLNTSP